MSSPNGLRLKAASQTDSDDTGLAPDTISIQLYSLRGALEQGLDATLAALASIGYRRVELAGTHGLSAEEFRVALDRHGLWASSGHVGLDVLRTDPKRALDDASTLGHMFVVCPWLPPESRSPAAMKDVADVLNRAAEMAGSQGLHLGYHNHDFEFWNIGGVMPYDVLTSRTDPDLVHLEVDLYWVVRAGYDPATLLALHRGRVRQVHVKDMASSGEFADLGAGRIGYPSLLRLAAKAGAREYIVEHDAPTNPLMTARIGWEYLTRIDGDRMTRSIKGCPP